MAEKLFMPEHSRKYSLPYSIQHRVCMCEDPTWGKSPYSWVPYCGKCNKPMRWLVEKCRAEDGCGEFYIRDFMHDGRCIRPRCQLCWNCFQKLGKRCDHTYRGLGWKHNIIQPPAGLNPRKFSKEELENVFDF